MCMACAWGVHTQVEADRPLADLAPLFETVQASFERMGTAGVEYERAAAARDTTKDAFYSEQSAYLSGLHRHVLGDEGGGSAARIFKTSAYVADVFNRVTNIRTFL